MFYPRVSTARLEVLFFICLSLAMLGTYLGVTSLPLVISLVMLSLGLLLLLWLKGGAQLFPVTRSTCARYKTVFIELCALVYILCAALSLYARFHTKIFSSNGGLVLLREQAITPIWKIDLIACAAIVISHITGHHDICDRIHLRVLWFGKQLHRFSGSLCDFFLQMLQEPDLECESVGQRVGVLGLPAKSQETSTRQGRTIPSLVDGSAQRNLQERFRYLRSLSMSPASDTIFSSVVTDAVKMIKPLGSQGPPSPVQTQQLDVPVASQSNPMRTRVFQLPGTIETICVKALPDTGSSQNVIDKNLVQSLFPSIPMKPVDEFIDKLLVAPDGQPIPCIGKIALSWVFKDESEKHHRWFYVVENCSMGVIIGNGFLRQTKTMSKHRHRLELTKPSDPKSPPPHLLSEGVNEARQDKCLRQLVLGRVNDIDTLASLDTGCEANLMFIDYAKSLGLTILPLPTNKQHVKYADGRRDFMLGQVEVDWSFFDTPNKAAKVIFYVLQKCVHPVIFGQRFIFSEDPWYNHAAALINSASEPAITGVVALERVQGFCDQFSGYNPGPQDEAKEQERRARKERAVALLQTQLRARTSPQPQQQAQTYHDDKTEYRVEDRPCRSVKACEPPLGHVTSDRSEITTHGTNSTEDHLSSCRWNILTSTKLLTRKVGRFLKLCEPPLEKGKLRVRWRCRCGRRMYDDFIECRPGAARELEESLNYRPIVESGARRGQRSVISPIGYVTRSTETRSQDLAGFNIQLHTPSQSHNLRLQRRNDSSAVINCDPECRWLLVCARGKKHPTTLSQLDVCSTVSDKELFQKLRKSYLSLKSKWVRIFSLKNIQSIRFVQFELHIKDMIDIRKVPDMPPENKRDEYTYQTCDLIPPVGDNLMTHLFHHPEDANEKSSITYLRAPKKRKIKLAICPQQGTSVGWGIHLVEGWVVFRVWLLILCLFLVGSLVFGVCWAALHHDLQSAFGISAYIVALGGLVAGTLQASLT